MNMNKIKFWLLAVLILPVGCTTQRAAVGYLAAHHDVAANICHSMFPVADLTVDSSETTQVLPGVVQFVNCDSIVKAAASALAASGVSSAQAATAPAVDATRVAVQCPPDTVHTRTVTKTVRDTAAEAAAQAETEKQRTRAENDEKSLAVSQHTAAARLKILIALAGIVLAYVALRVAKTYITNIPVIGWIAKFIL